MAALLHLMKRAGRLTPPLPVSPFRENFKMPDFSAHRHPVLAVLCPSCGSQPGAWCRRPSGHRAADLHQDRRAEADRVFIAQHGETASILRTASGWQIDPRGRIRD